MSLRSDNYSWQAREYSSVPLQLPIFISHFHVTYEIKARALTDLYVYLHDVCISTRCMYIYMMYARLYGSTDNHKITQR